MHSLEFYQEQGIKVCCIPLEEPITVGRSSENDVMFPEKSVSRHHATFLPEESEQGTRVFLRDEGSTNGVVVNGNVVQATSTEIRPGDEIFVGPFRVVLLESEGSEKEETHPDARETTSIGKPAAPWQAVSMDRLRALYEFARLELPADPSDLSTLAARAVQEHVGSNVLSIILENDDGPATTLSWSPDGCLGACLPCSSREVIGFCRSSGRVVVQQEPGSPLTALEVGAAPISPVSTVCLPLAGRGDQHLGLLYLESRPSKRFSGEDFTFLQLLSRALVSILQRMRKQLEQIRAQKAAEAMNRAKSDFLAGMSGELRTRLHAILSYAHFGKTRMDRVGKDKLRDYLSEIENSGNALLAVLNDLLDLAELDAGRMTFQLLQGDLGKAVRDLAAEYTTLLEAKDLDLRVDIKPADTTCMADINRLTQVLRNIISNAVKYSHKGTSMTVCVEECTLETETGPLEGLMISVADQGPGIPNEELGRIFEKFSPHGALTDGRDGTGLGLAICKEIVAAHGGWIRAENLPDAGGLAVRFAVPREPPAGAPCRARPHVHKPGRTFRTRAHA